MYEGIFESIIELSLILPRREKNVVAVASILPRRKIQFPFEAHFARKGNCTFEALFYQEGILYFAEKGSCLLGSQFCVLSVMVDA